MNTFTAVKYCCILHGRVLVMFKTASYEPRHEKICLRGVRPGHRHKMVVTDASWRLEFGIKERAYATLSLHLHNKRSKKAYYMDCTVYKRKETFRGVRK